MSDNTRRDQMFSGNMAPGHSAAYGYQDQRSQQPTTARSGVTNAQQLPPSQQAYDGAFWISAPLAAQHRGHTQVGPQSSSFESASYTPSHQSFSPVPFGNPSYQAPFDPAAQMLHNWAMTQSGFTPGMQYPLQQYPMQRVPMQQTPFQQTISEQTTVQQTHVKPHIDVKQDSEVADAFSGDYADCNMDDDPSAQLMAELTQDIPGSVRAPTALEESDDKYQDDNQGWGSSVINATELDFNNSMFSDAQVDQNIGFETFKSFESQDPVIEAEKIQEDQLVQQVEQVVADLIDEGMQDVFSEEQTTIRHIPDCTNVTVSAADDYNNITDEGLEHSASIREASFPVDDTKQIENATAGSVHGPEDTADDYVEEEDIMQSGVAQEYVVGDHESQDDASDHTSQEDDMDEEEEVTLNETVEDEDVDVDISEAEPSSEQEAHDSGAEVLHQVEFEGYTLTESTQKTIKRTIAKKEDKELHHKASKLQPHHLPEHRYWVAILMHTMQPHKAKVEKDFVWLKGHKTNTVETMWNKYREVTTEEQHQILFCGRVPQFTDTLEELDRFGDKLIVFRAAKQEVIVID